MPWRELGAVLNVMVIVFIVGNIWFHFVEAILKQIKRLFHIHQKPTVWHTLSPEQKPEDDKHV